MGTRTKFYIQISFLFLVIISCSKDNLLPNSDAAYFPLSVGRSDRFDIERTYYSLTSLPETHHFTTRRIISGTFKDINGQLVFQTMYYIEGSKSELKLDSVATCWQTPDKALSQENGQTIINMVFPLADKLMWNGNLFNSEGEVTFKVVHVGKPYQIGTALFPNTIEIIRQDDSTLLSRNKYIEIYAKDVGLIRREKIILQYCNTPDCLGKGIVNSGWTELSLIKNN